MKNPTALLPPALLRARMLPRLAARLTALAAALALAAPAAALEPYAARLFSGQFKAESLSSFSPDYRIAIGDKISLRVWGALVYEGVQSVDAQGNVFLPQVGPIKVLSARNADLNQVVASATERVFRSNVGIYAALDTAQPVKVFVTGMAKKPGLYAGTAGDSILSYLDKASGVDPARGSYVRVQVLRAGQVHATRNLYDFLGSGQLQAFPLADGDTIVVAPKGPSVELTGEVLNENEFEYDPADSSLQALLERAGIKPTATHLTVTRQEGNKTATQYHPLTAAKSVMLKDGDKVRVNSDTTAATMLIRVEGAHEGAQALILPVSATLADVLGQLKLDSRSNMEGLQLFRKSVAVRQQEAIATALDSLQSRVLNSPSQTQEEAQLRKVEAELALQFISKARLVQPKGQVVLSGHDPAFLLEDGDVLKIPRKSSLVHVNGEVSMPSALAWQEGQTAKGYVEQAGGLMKSEDDAKILVIKANGRAVSADKAGPLTAGDEVLVLPEVRSKNVELTRSISQIIYQIAVSARVIVGLL